MEVETTETNDSAPKANGEESTKKENVTPSPEDPIPQLEGITFGEMKVAVKVLQAVGLLKKKRKRKANDNDKNGAGATNSEESGLEMYKHSNLRPLRKVIAQCIELQQRLMYDGKSEDEFYKQKMQARSLKRQKMAERDFQKKHIADTALRKGRIQRMKEKQQEAEDEEKAKLQQMMMIPDGHVETIQVETVTETKLLENGSNSNENENKNDQGEGEGKQDPVKLPKLRSCYVCKVRFRELHQFYDQLCPSCAALNWEKRHQGADLTNKVAVVTGSRVKIGYQTCLKLLRAGATVVATTRFPNAAAATYRNEPDFLKWKDRLHVYGLDLRDITGIEAFTRFLKMRYSECGLDILINNACQTIRRPTAYYLPACEKEEKLWEGGDDTHKSLLGGCLEFERVRRRLLLDHKGAGNGEPSKHLEGGATTTMPLLGNGPTKEPPSTDEAKNDTTAIAAVSRSQSQEKTTAPFESTGMSHSAAMSQMILLPEDAGISDEVLPPGVTDINGQQLDLRKTNSWLLKMEEVSTPEVMECMFINAIAPFVLNSRLKPLMCIPSPREDRYVINVSAMEGKFYRYKMANHPHTNMAKAALNMMTRTSAEDLAKKHNIYMNSVDTGWINDENPLDRATKTAKNNLFQTPIDEIDAAARILDPVFTGVNKPDDPKDFGKFLKDYRETEW